MIELRSPSKNITFTVISQLDPAMFFQIGRLEKEPCIKLYLPTPA